MPKYFDPKKIKKRGSLHFSIQDGQFENTQIITVVITQGGEYPIAQQISNDAELDSISRMHLLNPHLELFIYRVPIDRIGDCVNEYD